MADIHPMHAIRDRLWRVASDIRGDDDEIQAHMRYRMRLWALNVAAGISDNFTMHAEDGSLAARAIAEYREQQSYDAVVDGDALYEVLEEVDEACERMIELESIEEGMPTFASARAAIMAIQYACQQPDLEDLRALALVLANVPEQAALSVAYKAIDMGMDAAGIDPDERTYFITRETDDRVNVVIEGLRRELGVKWLSDLEQRLTHGTGDDFDPPTGESPKYR